MVSEQSYMSARKWSLEVNCRLRAGCWAPFSCSWGTEGGPKGPRPGARHTLQHDRQLSNDR
jgi:hypothetical protein